MDCIGIGIGIGSLNSILIVPLGPKKSDIVYVIENALTEACREFRLVTHCDADQLSDVMGPYLVQYSHMA